MYLTRDIVGAMERWEKYHFDKMIYVVASQQDLHMAQFFKILQLTKHDWASRLEHINFGLVTGMSTRKGTAVFLNQIIRESADIMLEQMMRNQEKFAQIENPDLVAREIGLTAIKVQDMQAKRYEKKGDIFPFLYAYIYILYIFAKIITTPHFFS